MNKIIGIIKRIGFIASLASFMLLVSMLVGWLLYEFYTVIRNWVLSLIIFKRTTTIDILYLVVTSLIILFTIALIIFLVGEISEFCFGNYAPILLETRDYTLTNEEKKKITVIIPAYNEEKTIQTAIESVKPFCNNVVVVNDGSTDKTEEIARNCGAIIVKHKLNKGLGISLRDGIKKALALGSEIIVNFDADLQYQADDIPKLAYYILHEDYDLMMGSRFAGKIREMPWLKRFGNRLYTKLLRYLTKTGISDGQTGFRMFTAEFARNIKIRGDFTYTQEMILEAAAIKAKIGEIPILFSKRLDGESRLMKSPFHFARASGIALIKVLVEYNPLKIYSIFAGILIVVGFYLSGHELMNLILHQSMTDPYVVIIGVIFFCTGILIIAVALLAASMKK